MSERADKCEICGALIDEEDLFCSNCGVEVPLSQNVQEVSSRQWTYNFSCNGCGASMSYDASAQNLVCPFCGNEQLVREDDVKMLGPRRVLPFSLSRAEVEKTLIQWLAKGFWRPADLTTTAQVHKVAAVYVPYWVFHAETHTFWTADTSQTPPGSNASWYPISGDHRGVYEGILIGASQTLTAAETNAICPFNLASAVPPEEVDLDNAILEPFRVARKYARPLATEGIESLEEKACAQYVPGRCRNVRVNMKIANLSSEPVLLPVWIMAYQYRGKLFRFLANGQTGKCWGDAPISWLKYALAVFLLMLAIGGCFLSALMAAGMAR